MEIGSKTKKIVIWGATGLAAAGLLTGTFFTGMAVAENTEPASVTSELDGELPDRPQRGEDRDGEGRDSDARDGEGRDSDAREGEDRDGEGRDSDAREGEGRDGDGQEGEGRDSDARNGDGPGPRHGHRDRHGDAPSEPEPSESAPAESGSV